MLVRFSISEMRKSGSPICACTLPIFLLMFVFVPLLSRAQNQNGSLRGEVQDASASGAGPSGGALKRIFHNARGDSK